jgi:hypothetical protein
MVIDAGNTRTHPDANATTAPTSPRHASGCSPVVIAEHDRLVEQSARLKTSLCAGDLVNLHVIGKGQHGSVYRALHLPTLALLATKTVNVYNASARHQLVKELVAYAKLSSPHVVQLLGAYLHEDSIVLASEYMDLGDLKRLVEHSGPLPECVLKHVLRQALLGLGYLHRNRQVHRDIKPDNVLINHRARVKIADFGLLKELQDSQHETTSFLGTLTYLSPERLASQPYSYAADVWAMGLVGYFCATGKHAFDTGNYWDLFEMVTREPCPPLDEAMYSAPLRALLADMLIVDPHQRPDAFTLLSYEFLRSTESCATCSEQCHCHIPPNRPLPTAPGQPRAAQPLLTHECLCSPPQAVLNFFQRSFRRQMRTQRDEYVLVLDLVLEAHFHGLLRIPRRALGASTAAAAAAGAGGGDGGGVGVDSDDEVVWVRGYRPMVTEDEARIERLANMFAIEPERVRVALEQMLDDKKREFKSFKLYLAEAEDSGDRVES